MADVGAVDVKVIFCDFSGAAEAAEPSTATTNNASSTTTAARDPRGGRARKRSIIRPPLSRREA
jgi:hypothetical protein